MERNNLSRGVIYIFPPQALEARGVNERLKHTAQKTDCSEKHRARLVCKTPHKHTAHRGTRERESKNPAHTQLSAQRNQRERGSTVHRGTRKRESINPAQRLTKAGRVFLLRPVFSSSSPSLSVSQVESYSHSRSSSIPEAHVNGDKGDDGDPHSSIGRPPLRHSLTSSLSQCSLTWTLSYTLLLYSTSILLHGCQTHEQAQFNLMCVVFNHTVPRTDNLT